LTIAPPNPHIPPDDAPVPSIIAFVARSGLLPAGAAPQFTRLTGGISSDIWLVEAGTAALCVKRALPQLRVSVEWLAPIERNATEAAWFKTVAGFMPDAVPTVLADDAAAGVFAMQYLPGDRYHNWKVQLLRGVVEGAVAGEVGRRLGRIHSTTAQAADLQRRFATDAIFHAIRLEPYLLATARVHGDLAPRLAALAETTATTRRALVHGDVSPKNILVGPAGPVFIDAECAWYGDPAFDLAFCLNHLLLKCLALPAAAPHFLASFSRLWDGYRAGLDWEDATAFEARAAALLPALFLARIDGKSPVEYVTDARDKDRVRRVARSCLIDPPARLSSILERWQRELGLPAET
jgi:aminoglycoside phosphotransferase (APT) family kinase protein